MLARTRPIPSGADKQLEILYDHYKDTFGWIREYFATRDKLLALILVVAAIMLLLIFSPKDSGALISRVISRKIGLDASIDPTFINSIVWFCLLALALKYFQTMWFIERQYRYTHRLEESVAAILTINDKVFSRQGEHYLRDYPLFSEWSHFLYTIAFPLLLLAVVSLKIKREFVCWTCSGLFYANAFMSIAIVLSVVLYLVMLHWITTKKIEVVP
jgi:hypothetical protein